jgi:glycerol-3-phosphate dehydrogenase
MATSLDGLGQHFGGDLYEAEARYLIAREWAQTAEDILTRRTKHNLHLTTEQQAAFTTWMRQAA